MIKKTITYEDFDGNFISEDHYFHLSKSELFDMELAEGGSGMSDRLISIARSGNGAQIMKMFKDIIGAAYGQRVDGSGSKFHKSPQLTAEFMGSLAFDALLTELITDPSGAASFINGIMPKDLAATAEQVQKAQAAASTPDPGARWTREEIIAELTKNSVPDPNNLDTGAGTWPSPAPVQPEFQSSGLGHPFDAGGDILPWAFRHPTEKELRAMNRLQLAEVYQRKNAGWNPPS